MPQSALFYCSRREEIGIVLAALSLWKIRSAGQHVSVCLTPFRIVLSACIWICLGLVFVRLNIPAVLYSYDVTREEEVPELDCADLDHLIEMIRFLFGSHYTTTDRIFWL